jgi:hypothetical protein
MWCASGGTRTLTIVVPVRWFAVPRQKSIRPKLHLQLTVWGTNRELILGVNDGVEDCEIQNPLYLFRLCSTCGIRDRLYCMKKPGGNRQSDFVDDKSGKQRQVIAVRNDKQASRLAAILRELREVDSVSVEALRDKLDTGGRSFLGRHQRLFRNANCALTARPKPCLQEHRQ